MTISSCSQVRQIVTTQILLSIPILSLAQEVLSANEIVKCQYNYHTCCAYAAY